MKTNKGIFVDLIRASDGLKPLDVETGDTVFVRMPHGNFKVRIVTPQPADVSVHLDGTHLGEQKVAKGMTLIEQDQSGRPFRFAAPGTKPAASTTDGGASQTTLFKDEAPDASLPLAPSHGLVMVSVKFSEQSGRKADKAENVFFQMNTPKDHANAVACNLHRIIPPEGITHSGCSCCK